MMEWAIFSVRKEIFRMFNYHPRQNKFLIGVAQEKTNQVDITFNSLIQVEIILRGFSYEYRCRISRDKNSIGAGTHKTN